MMVVLDRVGFLVRSTVHYTEFEMELRVETVAKWGESMVRSYTFLTLKKFLMRKGK